MKVLYLDCGMGAAGDMLTAALLELFEDKNAVLAELNALCIPGVQYIVEKSEKCGLVGTHMRVLVEGNEEDTHHHHHSGMVDIARIVSHINASPEVRQQIMDIYWVIAGAESKVHGVPVTHIHFHEVGAMDAIADVAAVCYLMDKLKADKVCASPVHVGSGQVKCAHGLLPVPAPATANILTGIPIYGGAIKGELCTPTGAALLRHFVKNFGDMPAMAVCKIGYGMGKKDFEAPNCVRAMLGEIAEAAEQILELSCNLDDMTGEAIGFAMEMLLAAGALDVFTTAIGMKKNRPGIMLTVLCHAADKEKLLPLIFKHTTTLGIREKVCNRYTLTRRTDIVQTPYGPVRQKIAEGFGVERRKYEYEDLAKIARENNLSLVGNDLCVVPRNPI